MDAAGPGAQTAAQMSTNPPPSAVTARARGGGMKLGANWLRRWATAILASDDDD
jgi:hypothetical protein